MFIFSSKDTVTVFMDIALVGLLQAVNRLLCAVFLRLFHGNLVIFLVLSVFCQATKTKASVIKDQSFYHIETSKLICGANQLTGFCTMATLSFNELMAFQELRWVSSFCGRIYWWIVCIFSIDTLHSLSIITVVFCFTRSSASLILQTFK